METWLKHSLQTGAQMLLWKFGRRTCRIADNYKRHEAVYWRFGFMASEVEKLARNR
jgi:hypothetical protein